MEGHVVGKGIAKKSSEVIDNKLSQSVTNSAALLNCNSAEKSLNNPDIEPALGVPGSLVAVEELQSERSRGGADAEPVQVAPHFTV